MLKLPGRKNRIGLEPDAVNPDCAATRRMSQLFIQYLIVALVAAAAALYIFSVMTKDICLMAYIDGKPFGFVKSRQTLEGAIRTYEAEINADAAEYYTYGANVTYRLAIADSPEELDRSECAEKLRKFDYSELSGAYMLYIDGTPIAACESKADAEKAADMFEQTVYKAVLESDSEATGVALYNDITCEYSLCRPEKIMDSYAALNMMLYTVGAYNNSDAVSAENKAPYNEENSNGGFLTENETGADNSNRISAFSDAFLFNMVSDDSPLKGVTPSDMISTSYNRRYTLSGGDITLSYKAFKTETHTEIVPCPTEYIENENMFVGTSELISLGSDGLSELTYEITLSGGEEVSRTLVSNNIIIEPVSTLYYVGTKPLPDAVPTGTFILPLDDCSRVTSWFGVNRPEFDGSSYHYGIDIAAETGTPIYASDGGKVIFAQYYKSYGLLVKIDNGNNIQTLYAHMSKILVKVGDSVYQGQTIGLVGKTGVTTGSHLHFEVRRNGYPVNPLKYISLY